jgi:anti-anti-sigma regulatory factor
LASVPDLSPLDLQRTGDHLRFVLSSQQDILSELPKDYEQLLNTKLTAILAESQPLTAEVHLRDLAGISSRQLGSLIALQKVLRQRFGRVPITGVSDNVRRVLSMTHVAELFELR